MTPLDPERRKVIDELRNALQTAVLLAEHLERTSSATMRDATALILSLRRATTALQRFLPDGGGR